jgi:flavin reductase (DIM6/NTAB) family NADH-FMN oxidoreductase RutF
MKELDPVRLGTDIYPLLNSLVVPRPIAWVSSQSPDGELNLAPHSYFTVSSVDPPVISFTSIGTKDTLRNVRATGEFVVNLVTRALADFCNTTATDFPAAESEFDIVGLATVPSRTVAPPRVAASPVALECVSAGERSFGAATVVFGEVRWIAVDDAVLAQDGYADIAKLAPVARLGRNDWGEIGDIFTLRRVPYDEWRRRHGDGPGEGQPGDGSEGR